jgi:UDP-GlcNAc:undecaprenyl-phosphate/decaprenyl-phosphate GlcNAc-1-phosphate transferase
MQIANAISTPTVPHGPVTLSVDGVLGPLIWVFFAAYIVSYLLTPVMRRVAIHYGIVDRPDGVRKIHREPVAYLGGVAVFCGWFVGITVTQLIGWHLGPYWSVLYGPHIPIPVNLAIAAILVVGLGLGDDLIKKGIAPRWKIAGQVLAGVTLLSAGIGTGLTGPFLNNIDERLPRIIGTHIPPGVLAWLIYGTSCALTTAIIVFCCNASNLMDGLDGLCGGVTAIIAIGMVALAVNLAIHPALDVPGGPARDGLRVVVALSLLGATLGFLPYNFNPASIFMGDSGSLFLGFTCALMIILLGEVEARWLLAALVMFSLPVLDTALAFARRKLAGRPLFSPDKQHLHHQLIARGLSVKQAVLVAYGLAIFFVLCGIAIVYIRTRFAVAFYLVLFGSIVVAAYKMGMVHERVVNAPRAEMGGTGIIEVPPGEDNTPIG